MPSCDAVRSWSFANRLTRELIVRRTRCQNLAKFYVTSSVRSSTTAICLAIRLYKQYVGLYRPTSIIKPDTGVIHVTFLYSVYIFLPPPRRICNRRYLFICLLATLRKNFLTDLHEIFREGCQWADEQMKWLNFGGNSDGKTCLQTCTEYSRCGWTRDLYKCRIICAVLYTNDLFIIPKIILALFMTFIHCFNTLSPLTQWWPNKSFLH